MQVITEGSAFTMLTLLCGLQRWPVHITHIIKGILIIFGSTTASH